MLCLIHINNCGKWFKGSIRYNHDCYTAEGASVQDVISELKEKIITLAVEDRKNNIVSWTGIDKIDEVVDDGYTGYKVILDIDMDREFAKRYAGTVRRTVTLPAWLDQLGKEAHVNFSQTMQESLIEKLGIRDQAVKNLGYTRSAQNSNITGEYVIEVKEKL